MRSTWSSAGGSGPLDSELPAGARVVVLDEQPGFLARLAIVRADPRGVGVLAAAGAVRPSATSWPHAAAIAEPRRLSPPRAAGRPGLRQVPAELVRCLGARSRARADPPGADRTDLADRAFPSGQAKARHRVVPALMRRYYPRADQIVTVWRDLADDLARFAGLARSGSPRSTIRSWTRGSMRPRASNPTIPGWHPVRRPWCSASAVSSLGKALQRCCGPLRSSARSARPGW